MRTIDSFAMLHRGPDGYTGSGISHEDESARFTLAEGDAYMRGMGQDPHALGFGFVRVSPTLEVYVPKA